MIPRYGYVIAAAVLLAALAVVGIGRLPAAAQELPRTADPSTPRTA